MPLQQALRHLDRAFRNFFEGRAKYPVLQAEARAAGGGIYQHRLPLGCRGAHADVGQDGRAFGHPLVASFHWAPTIVTISRDPAGRYFVSFLVEEEVPPLPPGARPIGFDMGA